LALARIGRDDRGVRAASLLGLAISFFAIGCAEATQSTYETARPRANVHRQLLPPPTFPDAPLPPSDPSATAIAFAEAQLGKRYCWGGTGPNCFDCSGLVQSAWRSAGARLPRTTDDQARALVTVPLSEVRPGDIFWWSHGHVGLYVGNGTIIDAYHSGAGVVRRRAPMPDLVLRVTAYGPDVSSSRQGPRPRSTSHRRSSP
jgi:cell wall-associated NlpC family hydrolase